MLGMTPCLPSVSLTDLRAGLVDRSQHRGLCSQPTQWHTSAEAPEPSESADADRAGSDWGASTSGRQPVDFIFGFLPEARKQELAAGRGATGELDIKKSMNRAWTCRCLRRNLTHQPCRMVVDRWM